MGTGTYCTKHNVKEPFFMPVFSTRQIITHLLHVNKSKFNSGIGYYMIIGHDLVVKLGLISYFNFSVFGWDDTSVHIKDL